MACIVAPVAMSVAFRAAASLKPSAAKVFAKSVAKPCMSRRTLVIRAEGPEGMSWYPGAEGPSYLDGSMPGDYGFDPLRLGGNASLLPYFQEAEIQNGRWAMMATAGILFTEFAGFTDCWWTVGQTADSSFSLLQLVAVQAVVMSFIEGGRMAKWQESGKTGVFGQFPFDPMGMDSPEMRIKEVKNGRLAMVAFLGFCSEAAVRGLTPIAALNQHIENPADNIYNSSVGGEVVAAIIALSIIPCIISAKNSLSDGEDEEFRPIPW